MNEMKNIDKLIIMNDLQQISQPSTTAVSTTVPSSEDFQKNRTQNLANLVGSIQQTPWFQTEEGMQILSELAMTGTPMGSVRGGKAAKSVIEQLLDLSRKHGIGRPKSKPMTVKDYNFQNKLSKARMQNQQALDKYGIADPDKKGMVDPVTALLNYFSKN